MIHFEGRWICAVCKPIFVQQLKEGVLAPVAQPLPPEFEEQPLSFTELVKLSSRVICQDWLAITGFVLLFAVPTNFVMLIMDPGKNPSLGEIWQGVLLQQFLETFFDVVTLMGVAKIVSERLQGRKMGLGGALRHALRRWLPGIGTGILERFILVLLAFALIVPAIIGAGYYTFCISVVSLRGCAGKSALDYSKALVTGRWWGVFGRMLGMGCIAVVPVILMEIGLSLAGGSESLSFAKNVMAEVCSIFASVGATILFLNLDAIHCNDPVFDSWRPRR